MTRPSDRPIPAQRDLRSRPEHSPDHGPDHRGLLHDVGHGLTTVALLLEASRDGVAPVLAQRLLDLAEAETTRLLGVVHTGLRDDAPAGPVAARPVLERIVELAELSRSTSVVLRDGADVVLGVDATALWRMVGNLVDNAVRAAGAAGHVEVALTATPDGGAVIEVADDGPGFHDGPPGVARIGLDVVTRLLAAHGGRLETDRGDRGGARVRLVLPPVPHGTELQYDLEGVEHASSRAL